MKRMPMVFIFSLIFSFVAHANIDLGELQINKAYKLEFSLPDFCATTIAINVTPRRYQNLDVIAYNIGQMRPNAVSQSVIDFTKDKVIARCNIVEKIHLAFPSVMSWAYRVKDDTWDDNVFNGAKLSVNAKEDDALHLWFLGHSLEFNGYSGKSEWNGQQWMFFKGTIEPQVENDKIKAFKAVGKWFSVGNEDKKCPTPAEGYAHWGELSFDISLDGNLTNAKRASCNDQSTASSGSSVTRDLMANKRLKEYVLYYFKVEELNAKLALKKAQASAPAGALDKKSPFFLHELSYARSEFLFSLQNIDFYKAKRTSQRNWDVVAIHNIPDNQTIFKSPIVINVDKTTNAYRFSSEDSNFYLNQVIPMLEPNIQRPSIAINHFTSNFDIAQVATRKGQVTPIIFSSFKKAGNKWQHRYDVEGKYQKLGGMMNDAYGFSFDEVFKKRSGEVAADKQRYRRATLSTAAKSAEDIALLVIEDETRNNADKIKGSVSRTWLYWEQYAFGNALKDIFEGNYEFNRQDGIFPHILLRYFASYSRLCPQNIPDNAPGFDYYTDSTYSDGYFSSEIRRFDGSIKVKPQYWEEFKRHHNDPPSMGMKNTAQMAASSMFSRSQNDLALVNRDIAFYKAFFNNLNMDSESLITREGCDSGFTQQLEQNLNRISANKPAIQKDSAKFTFRVFDKGEVFFKSDFYQSCIVYYGPAVNKARCACLDDTYSPIINEQESNKYIENFKQLEDDALGIRPTPKIAYRWGQCTNDKLIKM